jgi:hypothetical protein
MTDRMSFERRMPLHLSVERFIRPTCISGGELHGHVWQPELGREVPVKAFVPKNWDTDEAIEAAAAGRLVLDRSLRRLTRALS